MEQKNFKRTTVTAALPYANGGVHIGHLAGVYVPADIYVRYLRLKKQDVVFIGGSDEHGVPVTIRAKKEGITVQEVVDRYHNLIKKSFEDFGISFDVYSRTTSKVHNKFASDFFRTLYDKGVLEEKVEEQFCDEVTGEFLTDRNIVGTCPRCGAEGAYGDQCEKCGATLSPEELINPTNKNNPGQVSGLVEAVDPGRSQGVAFQCLRTVQELVGYGSAASCDDPRPGLGYSCSCRGSRRQGSLCLV